MPKSVAWRCAVVLGSLWTALLLSYGLMAALPAQATLPTAMGDSGNQPPALTVNSGLTLFVGTTAVIHTAHLQTIDAESGPDALTYTLRTAPLHGVLLLHSVPLTVGSNFTQLDIDQGALAYAHQEAEAGHDIFTFAVTDAGEPLIRASVSSSGEEGNGSSDSFPALSAGGRYVVYWSAANNLVVDDDNESLDIFAHDQLTGQTTRLSVSSNGEEGNGDSIYPAISADGQFVAFTSAAGNLVADDNNQAADNFVHHIFSGETSRVSINSDGEEADGASWFYPAISAGGRFVAFISDAANLGAVVTGTLATHIYVHDRETGETSRVSISSAGEAGNGDSLLPSISADGRTIAFLSKATNLAQAATNGEWQVFVHDRQTEVTVLVSASGDGVQANQKSGNPFISSDGRYVAFESDADNLVADDDNNKRDIFVYDRATGEIRRISMGLNGAEANGNSYRPTLSGDGRTIAFTSEADNLIPGDENGVADVFVYDRQEGTTSRVSLSVDGEEGNLAAGPAFISADGRTVTFVSEADNLVANDENETADVFVHDRGVIHAAFAITIVVNPPIFLPFIAHQEPVEPEPDPAWLVYLNQFRTAAGLHPVTENSDWSSGSWLHSRYMVKNDVISHSEDPNNPWYTLEGHLAGQNGNTYVSGFFNTADTSAINFWMAAPFHALPMVNPRLHAVGYGSYREQVGLWKMGATLDVRRGRGTLPPGFSFPLMFPAPGGQTWLRQFNGNEWPDPLIHCGYSAPTGAPVMLQIGSGSLVPQVTAHSFHQGTTPLPHCVFDETNFTHPDPAQQNSGRLILNNQDAIVLLPRHPLLIGESYAVSLTVNGQVYAWSFTVTSAPAPLQPWMGEPYRIGGER